MAKGSGSLAVQSHQTVVFIGDSITDCGRRAEAAPLGNGYVSMVVALVAGKYPQRRIRFINEGIGGDVVTGLRDRWGDDVLAHEPGWVSVLVGINDLHRTLRGDPTAVPPSLYRQAYTHCLRRTAEETSARLILMDPFYMCAAGDADDFQRRALELLSEYTGIVAELAGQFDAAHVRLHEMFQRVLRHYPADFIGPEPVHPNATGHLMIAHEWLHALQW